MYGRTIRVVDLFGEELELFYLLEWTDTNMFFCQDADSIIIMFDNSN